MRGEETDQACLEGKRGLPSAHGHAKRDQGEDGEQAHVEGVVRE